MEQLDLFGSPRSRPIPDHGDRARYISRAAPCRCVKCRAANSGYMRAYRAHLRGTRTDRRGRFSIDGPQDQ